MIAANYEYKAIYAVLQKTFVSNVSFVITDEDGEPAPFCLPMTAVPGQYDPSVPSLLEDDGDEETYVQQQETYNDEPFDVYLHGNTALLLGKMTREKGSVKVVVSATKVDGVVLHFAPNGHSLNYRSCVIHGDATPVSSPEEKRYAMHLLTNHMVRRRWSSANPVATQAMKNIQVIKVAIRSASAKMRAANVLGLQKVTGMGERDDVWTGVLPLYEVLGEPVESGYAPEREVQSEIIMWRDTRNREERAYAEDVAVQRAPVVKD